MRGVLADLAILWSVLDFVLRSEAYWDQWKGPEGQCARGRVRRWRDLIWPLISP